MTAKESRYVRKLEIKVEQLEAELKRTREQYFEIFHVYFDTRTALLQAFAAIEESAVIVHEAIKADPQYMAEKKRVEIMPNF